MKVQNSAHPASIQDQDVTLSSNELARSSVERIAHDASDRLETSKTRAGVQMTVTMRAF